MISYDLEAAIQYNKATFKLSDITKVIAELPGENNSYNWWWILKIKNKGYLLLKGGCDYTGWDCSSSIEEVGYFTTKLQAAKAAPENEEYYADRKIQSELIRQVRTGGTFWPEVKEFNNEN